MGEYKMTNPRYTVESQSGDDGTWNAMATTDDFDYAESLLTGPRRRIVDSLDSNILDKELDFLIDTIARHAQVELTAEQRRAAFELLSTMPKNSTLADFENACLGKFKPALNVSGEVIKLLEPLALALDRNNSYAGKFASVFDQST